MRLTIYLLVVVMATCKNTAAQNGIAVIASDKVIAQMPEVAVANAILKRYQDSLLNISKQLEETYNKKTSSWNSWHNEDFNITRNSRQEIIMEISKMITAIRNANEMSQTLTVQKAAELFSAIKNKLKDVVKLVAKENGYAYVLDISNEHLLYLPLPAYHDITDLVLCRLNL
jgi:outer membrane protein